MFSEPARLARPDQRSLANRGGDRLHDGGHVHEQRGELAAVRPLRDLLDQELRNRRVAWIQHVASSAGGAAFAASNTRLARMSSASIVVSIRASTWPASSRRRAWRRRARSSALRSERALAKLGCSRRSTQVLAERLRARTPDSSRPSAATMRRRDRLEFLDPVVREIDVVGDPRAEARIALEEGVHAVPVAGEDHHQVVALVLHHLHQDLDRLLAVVALVLGPIQVVRLVDEEHAAHGALQHFPGLRRRVADVLADEVVARDRDQVALSHVAEPVEDRRHAHGDRGLAGAGVAGEAHVQRGLRDRDAEFRARLVDHEQRGDLADAQLHRREPDELAVEFVEHRSRRRTPRAAPSGRRSGSCPWLLDAREAHRRSGALQRVAHEPAGALPRGAACSAPPASGGAR